MRKMHQCERYFKQSKKVSQHKPPPNVPHKRSQMESSVENVTFALIFTSFIILLSFLNNAKERKKERKKEEDHLPNVPPYSMKVWN